MRDRDEWKEFCGWLDQSGLRIDSQDENYGNTSLTTAQMWDAWLNAVGNYRAYMARRIDDLLLRNTELVEENRRLRSEPQDIARIQALATRDTGQDWLKSLWSESQGVRPDGERRETPRSIAEWADTTFGVAISNFRTAARANEEMAELLNALAIDDKDAWKAGKEISDVIIILFRLAHNLGVDIYQAIDSVMYVNRHLRTWNRDDTGHGHHVSPS